MNSIIRRIALRGRSAVARTFGWRQAFRDDGRSYVDRVMERLDAGTVHPTLGPTLRPGAVERARRYVDKLVASGLGRGDRVVDFGCGTLRVGTFLMEYLDPGRYFGLDLDQRLLDLGVRHLPEGLMAAKQPILRVITDRSIADIAAFQPSYIFSLGVLQHVPPDALASFFDNVSALANEKTIISMQVTKLAAAPVRRSLNSWNHSMAGLQQAFRQAGLTLSVFDSRNGVDGYLMLRKGA